MNPKKRRQELIKQLNSAWGLVTLHGKTLGEVLEHLGSPEIPKEILGYSVLSQRPTYELFSKIRKYLLDKEEQTQQETTSIQGKDTTGFQSATFNKNIRFYEPSTDVYELASLDSLIESNYSKKKPFREQLAELTDPYLPPKNPQQTATLRYFQEEAARLILYKLIGPPNFPAVLLRADAGDGKTFAAGEVLRWLIDLKYEADKSFSPHAYLYVTKASIVPQTADELRKHFGFKVPADILVINYENLRSLGGKLFIRQETIVKGGEEHTKYIWNEGLNPVIVIWDECHSLKNERSLQAKIALALNEVKLNGKYIKQIFMSATPFSRVASAKYFCVAAKVPVTYGLLKAKPLTESHWKDFASTISSEPMQYSREDIRRLLKVISPYVVTFKNVRKEFRGINVEEIIDPTPDQRIRYNKAFEDYLEAKQKLEGSLNEGILTLVEFLKFRQAAELIKSEIEIPKIMYNIVEGKGKAAVCAAAFKPTIAKVVKILNEKYGVPRNKISLIWGGGFTSSEGKKKYTPEEIRTLMQEAMSKGEFPKKILTAILKQLQLEQAGLGEIPAHLELGAQNPEQRWEEIKRFQEGESLYCLFTFGAGGAGLNLQHQYEYTRERETVVTPIYNEMEYYQALHRVPRLTSRSNTIQTTLLYKGTIEVPVLYRLKEKSEGLNEMIAHSEKDDEIAKQILAINGVKTEDDEDEEEEGFGADLFDELDNDNDNDNEN